jgi:hypothetical protein
VSASGEKSEWFYGSKHSKREKELKKGNSVKNNKAIAQSLSARCVCCVVLLRHTRSRGHKHRERERKSEYTRIYF